MKSYFPPFPKVFSCDSFLLYGRFTLPLLTLGLQQKGVPWELYQLTSSIQIPISLVPRLLPSCLVSRYRLQLSLVGKRGHPNIALSPFSPPPSSCSPSFFFPILAHLLPLHTQVRDCCDKYSSVYVYSVENMRNSQLKDVRSRWKNDRFFYGKNRVMQLALGRTEAEEYKEGLHHVTEVRGWKVEGWRVEGWRDGG